MTSPSSSVDSIAMAPTGLHETVITHLGASFDAGQHPAWVRVEKDGNGVHGGFYTCAAATEISPAYIRADIAADLARQAEAMKRVIKEMQERYENWIPVGAPPSQYANPNALIHFQCFSEAEEDHENPEYFVTATWSERPGDAVRWCAINSPIFISRALIGGGNAED